MRIGFFGDSLTEGHPGVSYVNILCKRFPTDELCNFGRGGDSVVGTHERVLSLDGAITFDLVFVWTGVNDILAHITWASPITRSLLREPWANSRRDFVEQYRALLMSLTLRAAHVVAVAPLFIGEDLSNSWNQQLSRLSREIEALCTEFAEAEFLNLRPHMPDVGSGWCSSPFVEKSGLGTVWEAIALRDPEDVDRVAAERGLCYTVDGIHLNSRGAAVVADVFGEKIRHASSIQE